MKNSKKKLSRKIFVIIVIVLVVLYLLLLIICRNTDYVVVGEPEEGMSAQVVVPFRLHFREVCSFPSPAYSASRYKVKFKNGLVLPSKLALDLWLVDLDDLQEKGFPCH